MSKFVSLHILATLTSSCRATAVEDHSATRPRRDTPKDESEHAVVAGLPTPPSLPVAHRARD